MTQAKTPTTSRTSRPPRRTRKRPPTPVKVPDTRPEIRLQKILSQAGIASRRAAEELIRQGRVRLNGHTVTELGTRANPRTDRITIDGRPVRAAPEFVYILLNKPINVVTTLADPQGRTTVREI